MNALALARFFQVLGALVVMKNGGNENDVSKLLNYARLGALAGDKGREHLQAAVAKVERLVAEDRSLTDQELADLDASIRSKLARAAGVKLDESPAPGPVDDGGLTPTDASAELGAGGTDPA